MKQRQTKLHANKILSKMWTEDKKNKHERSISTVRPLTDNSQPQALNFPLVDAKKRLLEE